MQKDLQETTTKVSSEELAQILAENEQTKDTKVINKKPAMSKSLMELYGLHTPTSMILDYISNRKAFNNRLALAVFLFIISIVPLIIMENVFYLESLGLLIMVFMIFAGIILITKGKNLVKNDHNLLLNLELSEADYELVSNEYEKWQKQTSNRTIIAISLFILGVFTPMIVEDIFFDFYLLNEGLADSSLFVMVASGVYLLLYQHLNVGVFKKLLKANQRKNY
ncbi:MAG: hypothetical protein MR210_06070 [Erysipelotrichaceae bacterium]|nr:hypothetical protein [Erysipelotrichaceae bacterium]MDY5252384.1 hypothetical protein [Erysipelotrichaceae bacterium]